MTQRKPRVPATRKPRVPALAKLAEGAPVRVVPYDLCQNTISLLLQLPVQSGYILAKQWEQVCPELFAPAPPPVPVVEAS